MAPSGKAMSNDHLKPSRYLAFGTCSHEARLLISKVDMPHYRFSPLFSLTAPTLEYGGI